MEWRKRPRYGRTLLWMGLALLVAVGFGLVLLALYYLATCEELVISYECKEYAVCGERSALEDIRSRIPRSLAGAGETTGGGGAV